MTNKTARQERLTRLRWEVKGCFFKRLGTVGTLGILARILGKYVWFFKRAKECQWHPCRRPKVRGQESGVRRSEVSLRQAQAGEGRKDECDQKNVGKPAKLAEQSMRLEMKVLR